MGCNAQSAVAYYHLGENHSQMGDQSDSEKTFKLFNSIKENQPKHSPPRYDHLL